MHTQFITAQLFWDMLGTLQRHSPEDLGWMPGVQMGDSEERRAQMEGLLLS